MGFKKETEEKKQGEFEVTQAMYDFWLKEIIKYGDEDKVLEHYHAVKIIQNQNGHRDVIALTYHPDIASRYQEIVLKNTPFYNPIGNMNADWTCPKNFFQRVKDYHFENNKNQS